MKFTVKWNSTTLYRNLPYITFDETIGGKILCNRDSTPRLHKNTPRPLVIDSLHGKGIFSIQESSTGFQINARRFIWHTRSKSVKQIVK